MSGRMAPRLFGAAEVRLGRQRSPLHESGPNMVPYLRAANVKDGALDLSDVKTMNFEPSEQAVFALRPGDILVTEGSGSLTAVGASVVWNGEIAGTVCFQNTLIRIRPRAEIADGGYLGWWARAAFADGRFAAIASGASIYHLSSERLKGLAARLPDLEEQRRIAHFLSRETRRVAELLQVQASILESVAERRLRLLEDRLVCDPASKGSSITLNRLVEFGRPIMYGIVLPGPDVADGVPIVKGGDVTSGNLSLARLKRTTFEIASGYERSKLREGDLVISIRGSVGEVACVPAEVEGANITQDAARIAPSEEVEGRWLVLALQSPTVQSDMRARITGATIKGLNIWDLCRVKVPYLSRDRQAAVVKRVEVELDALNRLKGATEQQMRKLVERRQALITAAVTGRIAVSTASGVDA